MCDISKNTDLKTVTAYKVVMKREEKGKAQYYSWFAGTPLKVGIPTKQTHELYNTMSKLFDRSLRYYCLGENYFNKNMVGKTSGFEKKEDAFSLLNDITSYSFKPMLNVCVIELKLKGEIMQGTAARITLSIPSHHITYAGTEIVSIKEITCAT